LGGRPMSLDLPPLDYADFPVLLEHIDPDGDLLAAPTDEQPVVFDDDAYDRDER
jgi:hypothetical protein